MRAMQVLALALAIGLIELPVSSASAPTAESAAVLARSGAVADFSVQHFHRRQPSACRARPLGGGRFRAIGACGLHRARATKLRVVPNRAVGEPRSPVAAADESATFWPPRQSFVPRRPHSRHVVAVVKREPIQRADRVAGARVVASGDAALQFGMNLDLGGRGLGIGSSGEPSVAATGNTIFYTENFAAGYSLDGGINWTTINPSRDLPSVVGGFCCDQVVVYVPRVNRFVWLLQYRPDATGNAVIRMVIMSLQDLRTRKAKDWRRWDLGSSFFQQPGSALDQADLSVGSNALYLTVDKLNGGTVSQSHAVRIGFGQLLRSDAMDVSMFTTDKPYLHPVQHIQQRAYFVQHRGTHTIRVYYWDEGSTQYVWRDIEHASVADANWTSITPTPGGSDWLNRTNNSGGYRIRGATLAKGVLWLAWSAGRDATQPDGAPKTLFKQPHIEIAKIRASTLGLIGDDTVANDNHAFARPALDTTPSGDVGMTFAWGGGGKWYASQGVAFLTGQRQFWASLQNDADPPGGGATDPHGDYATIRAGWPLSECLVTIAVGWQNRQAVARLVTFDRQDNPGSCTPRPEFLEPSTINLACPSGVVTTSSPTSAQGTTVPSRPSIAVTISWQAPDGTLITHTVTTDQGGAFTDAAPPGQAGTWRVKAVVAGDNRYLSAQAECSFSVTSPPPGKLASAISIQCPPGYPNFTLQYTTLTITGRIEPPQINAPVTVTYAREGATPVAHSTTTDGSGNYTDNFTFDTPGNWTIQASWAGDATYASASSGVCPLEVDYRPR